MTSQLLSRLRSRLPSQGKRVKASGSAEVQAMPFTFETPGTMNINGGVFTDVAGDINKIRIQNYHTAEAGIVQLKNAISGGATHDSRERYPPPNCHPKTRKAVLDRILQWIRRNPDDGLNGVLWLHGPTGTGKSAIAQTIAERCSQTKELAASFFFSREREERNSTDHLWATIAFQIAQSIPELHDVIGSAVTKNPDIFHKSLSTQLQTLIVEPFSSLAEIPPNSSYLVILDGLDECKDAAQQYHTLMFVVQLITTHRIPLRFFITSCPEPHIRKSFDTFLQANSYPLCLDDKFRPMDDIRVFLRSEFDTIYQKRIAVMAHVSRPWPSDNIIQRLAQRSGGRFLYAATILRFIDDEDYSPTDQLTAVLNTSPSIAITGLDDIYKQVLTTGFKNTIIFAAKVANTASVPWVKTVTDKIVRIITRLEMMGISKQDSDNIENDIQALLYIISRCVDKNLNEWVIEQFQTRLQSMYDHMPDPIHHFTIRSTKPQQTKDIIAALRQNLNNAAQLLQTDLQFSRVEKEDEFKQWKATIGAIDSGGAIKDYAHAAYTTGHNMRSKMEGPGHVFLSVNNSKFTAGKRYIQTSQGASVTHIIKNTKIDAGEDIDISTIATG